MTAKTKDKPKLSICMIVKDEEGNLTRCLDSFLPIIHKSWCELIIVDTGSTDRTVEVAREYTDQIYFQEWKDDFSTPRNFGISKATGDRIMIVDADEELDQKTLYVLMDALLNPAYTEYGTIFIMLRNFYTLDTGEFAEVIHPRIFHNKPGEPLYQFKIHNKPRTDAPYLFLDKVIFNHYGYVFQKADLFIQKKERSLPMLEKEYATNPDDMHILTHIIKTYYATGDHKKVVEIGDHWLEIMRTIEYHEGWFAYLEVFANLMGSYTALDDTRGAERIMKESRRYSDRLISLHLILGQHYLAKKKTAKAVKLFEEALRVSRQEGTPYELLCTTNTAVIMPEILNYLAIIHFMDGDYEKSGKYLNEGIRSNANRLPLRWDIWNDNQAGKRLVRNKIGPKRRS